MYNILLTTLLVLSVIIVIAIFLQPQKNPSGNVFDNSGSEALFERLKRVASKRLCNVLQQF